MGGAGESGMGEVKSAENWLVLSPEKWKMTQMKAGGGLVKPAAKVRVGAADGVEEGLWEDVGKGEQTRERQSRGDRRSARGSWGLMEPLTRLEIEET